MIHKLRDLFKNSIRARWLFLVTAAFAAVILVVAATPLWTGDDPASASTRPTDTPVETATNTNTPTITNTPTNTGTPTNTPIPPTATDTPTNTPTNTPTPLQKPLSEADFALLNLAAGQKVWCGVAVPLGEPWILHVSVTPGTANGTLLITFDDATTVTFPILLGTSFSLTQSMGGRTAKDGLVKVEIATGTNGVGWVSALARPGSEDAFDETNGGGAAVSDNYCVEGTSATGPDDGVESAHAQIPY